jgi:outer membrane protein assembly factor BamE (lipoprotein component of BamABCDE complex)
MGARLSVLIGATVVLAASGCVFPIRLAEENPFRSEVVGFIEPGATTRVEVEETLGTPFYKFSDGRWWAYCAHRRMTDWVWVMIAPNDDGDGELVETASGTNDGDTKQYSLVLRFRDDDIVNKVVVIKDEDGCTHRGTICHRCGYLEVVQDGKKITLIGSLGTMPN